MASNIIQNAIQATRHGGKVIVMVVYDKATQELAFIVNDNGCGMDEKQKK